MPRVATRKGEQEPTTSLICEYKKTKGKKAVKLYNSTGLKAYPWQELLSSDIMACDRKGVWVHSKFGFSVSRQNGKNEVIVIRELYGLVELKENILHTAHSTKTAHKAYERLLARIKSLGIEIESEYKALGSEHIYLVGGGRIDFATRTNTGNLGTSYDLLIIDEAQEYQSNHESALKYVLAASANKQTIMLGTPPTAVSSGTVFAEYRKSVMGGKTEGRGWAEWAVDKQSDCNDRELWYLTNPSLGYRLTERSIADEVGDDVVDFNIQRLGLWLKYSQKSAISLTEWERLRVAKLPALSGAMAVGIKYNKDGMSVAMAVGIKAADGRTLVEVIDRRETREGCGWIVDWIRVAAPGVKKIIVDGANGQQLLEEELRARRLPRPYFPSTREIIAANAIFEPDIEHDKLCHTGQPSLTRAVTNSEHRAIGSNGGFGYQTIVEGVDVALIDAVILANWGAGYFPEKSTQTVSF